MAISRAEGLMAPEGTYTVVASYVLPPQPAFLAPVSGPTSMHPMSNNTAQPASGVAATAAAPAASASASGAQAGANAAATSGGNTAAAHGWPSTSLHASVAGQDGGTSENGTEELNGHAADVEERKTALNYISMHAPSAWSHAPVLPSSEISVASVRHSQQPGSSSLGSGIPSMPVLGGRRERQQPSHAESSMEGSNGSNSEDVGAGDGAHADARATAGTEEQRRPHWGPVLECSLAAQGIDGIASHVTGGQGGLPGMAALQMLSHLGNGVGTAAGVEAASFASGGGSTGGGGQAGSSSKAPAKPKNNIRQTSSSFVQRLQSHSELNKVLAPRPDGLTIDRHAFVSRGRMLYWLGETSLGWLKEALARLTFASNISSHDINQQTRSPNRLDIIIGFTTSDLLWLEAMSMRYSRINKAGCINAAPITKVRWVPGSETLFLTCHSDGTCTLFDVTRDDSSAGSWTPSSGLFTSDAEQDPMSADDEAQEELEEMLAGHVGDVSLGSSRGSETTRSLNARAMNAWDPTTSILVTKPAAAYADGDAGRKQWLKMNPIAHWRIGRSISIKDVAFSPDHTRLAIVSTDGMLRLINLLTESLEGSFQSYYGALNRVVWSHDARFLLTAGCDDLISVWTNDGRLLSRCIGHSSFVTGLAFDPWKWRPEDRTYRFISVGEDGRILLWDFSSAALHRPRLPHSASSAGNRRAGDSASTHRRSSAAQGAHEERVAFRSVYHSAQSRGEVAELQPVATYQFGPLTNVTPAETTPGSIIPFSPPTGTSDGVTADGGNGGVGAAANATVVQAPTSGTANGTPAPVTANVFNAVQATNAANEPGSPNDLLVDVRCRPDGIVVLHRSGTLRYLLRPLSKSTAQPAVANLGRR